MTLRPRIIVPGRLSPSASVLRFRAEVNAHALIRAVFDAGGEPLTVHPHAVRGGVDAEVTARFDFADGLLLPGGGDVSPELYGGTMHAANYDMDREQDDFDVALARWALTRGVPVLAICRGLQVANVALGGTLSLPMPEPHRSTTSLTIRPASKVEHLLGTAPEPASCYHHQAVCDVGDALQPTAWAPDGTVEALERAQADGSWFLGLQWHPEDTSTTDADQRGIFEDFVSACR